jgi:hypothetical protein
MGKHYHAIFKLWFVGSYGITYINILDERCPSVLKVDEVQLELDIEHSGKILNANNQYFKKYSGTFIWLQMFLRPRNCILGLEIYLNQKI